MKLSEFKKYAKNYDGYIQGFIDDSFESSCPCSSGWFVIDYFPTLIETRCWRVSDGFDQDLNIFTEHPKAEEIGEVLKPNLDEQKWYNPYKVNIKSWKEYKY